ncbi:hypothetical protein H0W91_02400 [Patescibacteria group bacterium]|nr:hypothetical protein [Patescibacteria group bacterium]
MTEKILELNNGKTIFWSLVGVLLLSLAFYMYFINITIHNVVARQNLESEASTLTLSIGNQEFKYITLRNNITLPLALSMGFREMAMKTFVPKDPSTRVAFVKN